MTCQNDRLNYGKFRNITHQMGGSVISGTCHAYTVWTWPSLLLHKNYSIFKKMASSCREYSPGFSASLTGQHRHDYDHQSMDTIQTYISVPLRKKLFDTMRSLRIRTTDWRVQPEVLHSSRYCQKWWAEGKTSNESYHPGSKGMIGRWHRAIKTVVMWCYNTQ